MKTLRVVSVLLVSAMAATTLASVRAHAGDSYLNGSGGYDRKGSSAPNDGGSGNLYDSSTYPTKVNPYSGHSGIDRSDPYAREKNVPGTRARSLGSLYEPPSE